MLDIILNGDVAMQFLNSEKSPGEKKETNFKLEDEIKLEFPSYVLLAESKEKYEEMVIEVLTNHRVKNKKELPPEMAKRFAKIMKDDDFTCFFNIVGCSNNDIFKPIFDVSVNQKNKKIIDVFFKFDEEKDNYNVIKKEDSEDFDFNYITPLVAGMFKIMLESIAYLNDQVVTKVVTKEAKNPKKKNKNKKGKKTNITYVYKTKYKFNQIPNRFVEEQEKIREEKRIYERKTECWEVRGFYRTYKKGTANEYKVWIGPSFRGNKELIKENPELVKRTKYKITRV